MKFQPTSSEQYVVNVTIGGQVVALAVDTGSSDHWVHVHVQDQLKTISETDIDITLNYGIGSASGNAVYGAADLGEYAVPSQAFLDVNEAADHRARLEPEGHPSSPIFSDVSPGTVHSLSTEYRPQQDQRRVPHPHAPLPVYSPAQRGISPRLHLHPHDLLLDYDRVVLQRVHVHGAQSLLASMRLWMSWRRTRTTVRAPP
ncbi:hypothetical protein FIBSPDRAFT_1052629 [Athelia psychrophila]|uniref:Peptidase A1 domain-containing protein n=1 Tax=Athelia psychrophila TaxID=1759441 RepID=A0A165WXR6_9AGAM|nr:hypothetical protein FIBSPDRAFT_1052629 [Fibularhizoctonia sp. CBS 109695]